MKNLKVFLTLIALLLVGQEMFSQASLKRANKQYELSVFDEAVESYKEVLKKNPNHREANAKIADCYRHLNKLKNAIPHYQTVLAQGGMNNIYIFQYGLCLQGLGRYELAKDIFEKLSVNDPKFMTRGKQFAEACEFAMSPQNPPRYKVTNEYVNGSYSDFAVALFKRDKVVYASSRSDVNVRNSRNAPGSGGLGSNKLLISQRDKNGYLESPQGLHSGFGTSSNEGPLSYSNDGRWAAFTKNNFTEGVRQIPSSGLELTLYITEVNANGDWSTANPFPHNGVGFSTGYPSFSPDGKALFFASDRPGGYGGFDLFVSYRVGNTWSSPENLGVTVNSLGNEITPFYNGLSLYFASDFHKGFGGFDIFRAEESNSRWATLYHGGTGLNSSYDDFGFVFDGLHSIGYFVSNREGGKGNEDIYKVTKETDNVVIKVSDATNGDPVADAIIDFADCEEESYHTNANGVFNFQLLDDLNCTVVIKKDGFLSRPIKITSMGLRQNRTLEVKLTNVKNAYQGKAVNASNGYYLQDVKVFASEIGRDNSSSTYTDLQGGYFISLKPNVDYLLRFSKPGFQDVTMNVRTSDHDDHILRNVNILPVGSSGKITPASEPVTRIESSPTTSGQPRPISPSTSGAKTILVSGYAVQVAALKRNSSIEKYVSALKNLATVYSVNEGGRTKVRVGIFEDRDDAVSMQKQIRSKGYDGAFIVTENNLEIPGSVRSYNSKTETKSIEGKSTAEVSLDEIKGYMVRLAAYSNLRFFDKEMVDDLGTLTYVPKGGFTIVLLRGYDAVEDANIALRKSKVRGFPDAHIVNYDRGEMTKVQ